MRVEKGKLKKMWHRSAALMLICALLLPLAPTAGAAKVEVKEGRVSVYEYRWIDSYDELTSSSIFPTGSWVPVMLAWENTHGPDQGGWGDGTLWYAKSPVNRNGGRTYVPADNAGAYGWKGDDIDQDFKYTADSSWNMYATGEDYIYSQEKLGHIYLQRLNEYDDSYKSEYGNGETKKSPRFRMIFEEDGKDIYGNPVKRYRYMGQYGGNLNVGLFPGTIIIGQFSNSTSFDYVNGEWFEAYKWNVILRADDTKKYSDEYRWGNVNFHYDSTGKDDHLLHKGSMMYVSDEVLYGKDKGDNLDEKNDWDRGFRIYTEQEIVFDAYVDDVVVGDGQTYRINKEMFVPDDVSIIVEDGGLCVINARVVLNGQITVEKGGTLIINEGTTVAPYINESDKAASVTINGGNVIVMEGAKLLADEDYSKITVTDGGSLINRGMVLARNLTVCNTARFVNEPTGLLSIGTSLFDYREHAHNTSASTLFEEAEYTLPCSIYLTGNGQIINRGQTEAGFYNSWFNGYSMQYYDTPVDMFVVGEFVCRNEGEGVFRGCIQRRQGTSAIYGKNYRNTWPVYE